MSMRSFNAETSHGERVSLHHTGISQSSLGKTSCSLLDLPETSQTPSETSQGVLTRETHRDLPRHLAQRHQAVTSHRDHTWSPETHTVTSHTTS